MKLFGKNPVLERIKANPGTIKKLYLKQKTDLSDIVKAAKAQGVGFESVDEKAFSRMAGEAHSQGAIAEVRDFQYAAFSDMLKDAEANKIVLVFLDGITDPQNFGAIIRNLACLGGFSIVIPEYDSVEVNETVLRVASGGENYLKISKIKNNVHGIEEARERGIWVVGADAENGENVITAPFNFPSAIVIGSEGKGIRPGIKRFLDASRTLPMWGAKLSYNAAVAASLFCYEVNRKRMN